MILEKLLHALFYHTKQFPFCSLIFLTIQSLHVSRPSNHNSKGPFTHSEINLWSTVIHYCHVKDYKLLDLPVGCFSLWMCVISWTNLNSRSTIQRSAGFYSCFSKTYNPLLRLIEVPAATFLGLYKVFFRSTVRPIMGTTKPCYVLTDS